MPCLLVGRNRDELLNKRFSDVFSEQGERFWLDIFTDAAYGRRHCYVSNDSEPIQKRLSIEAFHIPPNLCGCVVHDYKEMAAHVTAHENDELHYRANYDFLTGFYNRYYLHEVAVTLGAKQNIGVTYLDINNLKKTNDTYGHAAGDKLILKVAALIREQYEASLVFRVGGDEFVILTPELTRESFTALSQKAQRALEQDCLAAVGSRFYEEVEDLEASINECDLLMYEHKQQMKKATDAHTA
jgi:diguanylate cyclase (GGDEF)-like protein